ncbi:MAG: hypothetical protein KDB03_18305, partial [Planctomycetales bacterium]|nr:hypothetical protein [Planctomycetales bacterium]
GVLDSPNTGENLGLTVDCLGIAPLAPTTSNESHDSLRECLVKPLQTEHRHVCPNALAWDVVADKSTLSRQDTWGFLGGLVDMAHVFINNRVELCQPVLLVNRPDDGRPPCPSTNHSVATVPKLFVKRCFSEEYLPYDFVPIDFNFTSTMGVSLRTELPLTSSQLANAANRIDAQLSNVSENIAQFHAQLENLQCWISEELNSMQTVRGLGQFNATLALRSAVLLDGSSNKERLVVPYYTSPSHVRIRLLDDSEVIVATAQAKDWGLVCERIEETDTSDKLQTGCWLANSIRQQARQMVASSLESLGQNLLQLAHLVQGSEVQIARQEAPLGSIR